MRVLGKFDSISALMFKVFSWPLAVVVAVLAAAGCRMGPPLPPANLETPGWKISHGEAVWHRGALDIAGELLVARSGTNRSLVQFTKGPLQIVTARREGTTWEIQFPMQKRTFRGRGNPPRSLGWLHLASALAGQNPPRTWTWTRDGDSWRLESGSEHIEGILGE
jgi:hypothetical protein